MSALKNFQHVNQQVLLEHGWLKKNKNPTKPEKRKIVFKKYGFQLVGIENWKLVLEH